ncbi:hypothetical protein BDN71DRAFT_1398937 [Pleurotus eryngii]|uniref:Uncharacterized protein n=1 Tax=Pleurotus eryngii TaxID=5323 RepID=A0A9P5ZP21_PLEER|nr:hypothetical protein BDN71DRAFT_1398937 [Pleurotus eryngii]
MTSISNPKVAVHSWENLQTKIRGDLKKNSKNPPLSQLNQLMILSNFATLRIKGTPRIQASLEIAHLWRENTGNRFARRVQDLA